MSILPQIETDFLHRLRLRLKKASEEKPENRSLLVSFEKQFYKAKDEAYFAPCEREDPLGAKKYHVTERLIHQYKNRVLLLSTGLCFAYCRFCFRKNFTGKEAGWISEDEIEKACSYIAGHPEVKEILISGGDPLLASNERLAFLLEAIRRASPNILIRLGTRSLLFAPERFTASTIELLQSFAPLWIIPHINHPLEISEDYTPEVLSVIAKIRSAGIPMQSQTVLLKGVNDSLSILEELFHSLTCLGIKPGYLFQLDLAQGTSHFRLPIEKSLALYAALKKELSGLSCPIFSVDLPGGGGKLNLEGLMQKEIGICYTKTESSIFVENKKKDESWSYPRN
jgi:lysine 2,3-aminomutase